jgi:hypothetical protein
MVVGSCTWSNGASSHVLFILAPSERALRYHSTIFPMIVTFRNRQKGRHQTIQWEYDRSESYNFLARYGTIEACSQNFVVGEWRNTPKPKIWKTPKLY